MIFSQTGYYREKFTHLSLSQTAVTGIEFETCEFHDCTFINTRFIRCKFIGCTFIDCLLSAISPIDSRFTETAFKSSKIIGFDWTRTQSVRYLTFDTCQINYSNFKFLKLPQLKLLHCEAREVEFIGADLHDGVFTGTDFTQSIFSKTNLTRADFRGAANYYIDIQNNTLKNARFSLPEAISLLNTLGILID